MDAIIVFLIIFIFLIYYTWVVPAPAKVTAVNNAIVTADGTTTNNATNEQVEALEQEVSNYQKDQTQLSGRLNTCLTQRTQVYNQLRQRLNAGRNSQLRTELANCDSSNKSLQNTLKNIQ